MSEDREEAPELATFSVSECYVYAPIPPATSYGQRAELWDVDKWLKAVALRVVSRSDDLFIRLEDQETGELFAECPLPNDGTPLTVAVEPVIDSSRYFVLKVVDRGSRNHAFIGLGFRERNHASDFTAALDDYRQYLRRKREAEQRRQQYEQQAAQRTSDSNGEGSSGGASAADMGLKPGETIKLKLSDSIKKRSSGGAGSIAAAVASLVVAPGDVGTAAGTFFLKPPPAAGITVRPGLLGSAPAAAEDDGAQQAGQQAALQPALTGHNSRLQAVADGDDWGDFVS